MLDIKKVPQALTEKVNSVKDDNTDMNNGFKSLGSETFNEYKPEKEILPSERPFGRRGDLSGDSRSALPPISSGRVYIVIIAAIVLVHLAFAAYIEMTSKKPQFAGTSKTAITSKEDSKQAPAPVIKTTDNEAKQLNNLKPGGGGIKTAHGEIKPGEAKPLAVPQMSRENQPLKLPEVLPEPGKSLIPPAPKKTENGKPTLDTKKQEEAKKLEEVKKAAQAKLDAQRKEQEAKKALDARKAEEIKKAEEAKKAAATKKAEETKAMKPVAPQDSSNNKLNEKQLLEILQQTK